MNHYGISAIHWNAQRREIDEVLLHNVKAPLLLRTANRPRTLMLQISSPAATRFG